MAGVGSASTVAMLMRDALAYHQAGQFELAWEIYLRVLQEAPDRADAWYLAGLVEQSRGHLEQAHQRIGRAVELAPYSL